MLGWGSFLNLLLTIGTATLIFAVVGYKMLPDASGAAYGLSFLIFCVYILILYPVIKIHEKKAEQIHKYDGSSFSYSGFMNDRKIVFGLFVGSILSAVGFFWADIHFPNQYFYWGSIGPSICILTIFLFFFELTRLIDLEATWMRKKNDK